MRNSKPAWEKLTESVAFSCHRYCWSEDALLAHPQPAA
jgi:hypothetical protein